MFHSTGQMAQTCTNYYFPLPFTISIMSLQESFIPSCKNITATGAVSSYDTNNFDFHIEKCTTICYTLFE